MSDYKVALVTGASRGIGAAIAQRLSADGFYVVGTATSARGAEAITARFNDAQLSGEGRVLNVTDAEQVDTLVKSITKELAAPLVLINNAGITKDNIMLRMKADEWDSVIDTNLNSVFRVTKACLRGMTKARWGRIVNISSVVGGMGNPGQANYCATKAGVEGFTRSVARELGSRNVTCNAVAPGFIQTDMTDELTEQQKEAMLTTVPLNRLGQADEIAAAVAFLVSDSAAYITGETLNINGGMYM